MEVNNGKNRVVSKEDDFWKLQTPEMTPELKRELEILSMRGYWDTKSFFKSDRNRKEIPSSFEIGYVISGSMEGRSSRLSRRESKRSFASELVLDEKLKERSEKVLADEKAKRWNHRKSKKRTY